MRRVISIIIPIFNVEFNLKKCIDSIINQTYMNIEIILVDDGSTDSSGAICDEYASKDSRIVVIHKENGGLSSARNAGHDIAKGSLICFVDSDDYIDSFMIEKLKKNMDEFGSDISVCGFYRVINNSIKKVIDISGEILVSVDKDKFNNLYNKYFPLGRIAWNKLYKKDIFENIRYPVGRNYEDASIICDLLDKAKSVSYTLEHLYYHVVRKDSITRSFNEKNFVDMIYSDDVIISFFEKKCYNDLVVKEKNKKCLRIIDGLTRFKLMKIESKELIDHYYDELKKCVDSLSWKEASSKVKLFKLFGRMYMCWILMKYKAYEWGKRIYRI